MMAEWVLDGTRETPPGGFDNPAKPLGSLSVLLSELPAGAPSQFADGDVPRATFDNVEIAVRSWIKRAKSHPENFLFLFVSGHGESFGRRTAFLLEDYGTDDLNVTAGMSEVEQFVEALANVDVNQQLLIFDCCRTPTSLGLRFDQQFGKALINLPAATGSRRRRAHVLRSTGLGDEAYGNKNGGPTIFASVLLDALRGLAASASDSWTIDNFGLAATVARLLDLYVRDGETLQQPDAQLNAPFMISTVPERDVATVFVSLGPEHDFSKCRLQVDGTAVLKDLPGATGIASSFARLQLPNGLVRKIAALDADDVLIGETRIVPVAPVAFRRLPEQVKVSRSAAKGASIGSGKGRIDLSALIAAAPALSDARSFVAVIRPQGSKLAKPVTVTVQANSENVPIEVDPGWYDIRLGVSDGQILSSEVEVKAGSTATVTVQLSAPRPRALLPTAEASVPATNTVETDPESLEAGSREWLVHLGAPEAQIVGNRLPVADVFAAPIPLSFFQVLAKDTGATPLAHTGSPPLSLLFQLPNVVAVEDQLARRLPGRLRAPVTSKPDDQPVWAAAAGKGWREIAAIPSLGRQGQYLSYSAGEPDGWTPTLVVESNPRTSGSHLAVMVNTRRWAGLQAFLAKRDFELSGIVFEHLAANDGARNALMIKVENPFAAVAGALIAVATDRLGPRRIPVSWLRNLTNWFPQLPDGPVILARHLMSAGDLAARAEAKSHLLEAYRRGVPVFSLSVDWLAQGLADFADDPELAGPASTMWRIAQLSDPARAFTVLRVPV
jgi:hypothetical protein